ncbi:MAG: PHP domain-containing protein, partial [Thiomonas sp.]
MPYVHLRTHTEYSIVDGALRVEEMVPAAARDGQGALAISDFNNLFATVRFYKDALAAGVKPLIGCDVLVGSARNPGQQTRLLLLVQSHTGYLHLCDLLSRAWLGNQQRGRAVVQWEWLEGGLAEGLICLSGAQDGAIGQALLQGDTATALELARQHAAVFDGRFYIELQRGGHPASEAHVQAAVPLAA